MGRRRIFGGRRASDQWRRRRGAGNMGREGEKDRRPSGRRRSVAKSQWFSPSARPAPGRSDNPPSAKIRRRARPELAGDVRRQGRAPGEIERDEGRCDGLRKGRRAERLSPMTRMRAKLERNLPASVRFEPSRRAPRQLRCERGVRTIPGARPKVRPSGGAAPHEGTSTLENFQTAGLAGLHDWEFALNTRLVTRNRDGRVSL